MKYSTAASRLGSGRFCLGLNPSQRGRVTNGDSVRLTVRKIPNYKTKPAYMQRILNTLLGFALVSMIFVSTGCGEDETGGGGGGGALGPVIFLATGTDLISSDANVPLSQGSFTVQVDVSDGDSPLNVLTITEDGTNVPLGNLTFDGGATDAQNPLLILGADQNGTIYDIEITPTNLVANETRNYVFTITDQDGLRDEVSIAVTFTATPPDVSFDEGGLQFDQDRSVSNAPFTVEITGTSNDFPISEIAFFEDGILLPADSVIGLFGFNDPLTSNPELFDPVADGVNLSYEIRPVNPSIGSRTYTVELRDTEGGVGSASIVINFVDPMVDQLTGIVFNADGPNFGGLDLDSDDANANAVSFNSPLAEIRDQGIDLSQPAASNWIQRIEPVNGATLRSVNPADLGDNFSFDAVLGISEVIAAFDAGTTVSESDVIQVGDIFAVNNGSNYYLIRFDEVNVTTNNNLDNYVVSIINEAN